MPKNKFQDFVFTLMMVIVMVYAMICYNIAQDMGGMNNRIFLLAFGELPIMGAIAFLAEFFFVGKITQKITFQMIDPGKVPPIVPILFISALSVAFMCPIMSFFAVLLFKNAGNQFISVWLQTTILNFPMALLWQLFCAGPLIRKIFGLIFSRNTEGAQKTSCTSSI